MTEEWLYHPEENELDAADHGDLDLLMRLHEQAVDKNEVAYNNENLDTALGIAASHGHFACVRYLVEQGADMNKDNTDGMTYCSDGRGYNPLHYSCKNGNPEIARYLLDHGADRDKVDSSGNTPLHLAAENNRLATVMLLMRYGADLNARNNNLQLPIDVAATEEMKQAIREEPRRRMDDAPGKRATEEDRHPNAITSASAQQNDDQKEEEEEPSSKRPRLEEGEVTEEGKVAEEDEDSEPSDEDDD